VLSIASARRASINGCNCNDVHEEEAENDDAIVIGIVVDDDDDEVNGSNDNACGTSLQWKLPIDACIGNTINGE